MLPYRHMDTNVELSRPEEERRDDAAATSDDSPALPRHVFTMTVEDVSGLLSHHGFERDQRTIQRWCSAGKLTAILDHDAGDRYLIEPRSVDDVVATLVAERDRQERTRRRHVATDFQGRGTVATAPGDAATEAHSAPPHNTDTPPALHDTSTDAATASRNDGDDAATLRDRIKELEGELFQEKVDAESRKQLIAQLRDFYNDELGKMGERYNEAIEYALTRAERVGELEAENRHLKGLLPAGGGEPILRQQRLSFTPERVRQEEGDNRPPVAEAQRYNQSHGAQEHRLENDWRPDRGEEHRPEGG